MFSLWSNHEAGHVLDKNERRLMTIASIDKVSNLLGRFSVDDAAKLWRSARQIAKHAACICDHANLNSTNTRMTRNNFFRIICLKLIEMSFVEHTIEKLAHVVR